MFPLQRILHEQSPFFEGLRTMRGLVSQPPYPNPQLSFEWATTANEPPYLVRQSLFSVGQLRPYLMATEPRFTCACKDDSVQTSSLSYRSFYKKPLYKQPSKRKKPRNCRWIALWNHYLVQRNAVPKQREYDIALEFNLYWRILFVIGQVICYIHILRTRSQQFSSLNWEALKKL